MEKNHKALIAYVLGWLTGIIIYFSSKDKDLKFHGVQSILFSISSAIIGWILIAVSAVLAIFTLGISIILMPLYSLIILIIWIVLMVKAYQGEKIMLPIIGKIAERITK